MAGALPSDTVKNPKLNISPVSSARSYPTKDPQCSTHTHGFYAMLSTDITYKIACRKFLIKNEEEIFIVPGDGVGIKTDGVASPAMLYLMRRSLEILRNFHWMILGGRFHQLSHVPSPLLSKPREY
ncbi:hypothetical protein Tco_0849515 [Tanacetum coccineum]